MNHFRAFFFPFSITLFAFSLQCCFNWSGISLSAADLLLPFFLFIAFVEMRRKKTVVWTHQFTMLFLITLCFGFSLFYQSPKTAWAIKKGVGWLLLFGYFIVGSWIERQSQKKKRAFLVAMIVTSWFVALHVFVIEFFFPALLVSCRQGGLFPNPNAFGIFFSCTVLLHLCLFPLFLTKKQSVNLAFNVLGLVFSCFALLCSGSRGAIFSLCVTIVLLFFLKIIPHFFRHAVLMVASCSIAFSLLLGATWGVRYWKTESLFVWRLKYTTGIFQGVFDDLNNRQRHQINCRAFCRWLDHPILGIGLGRFLEEQMVPEEEKVMIHNSLLWILTEMGLMGLFLFFTFFYLVIQTAVGRIKEDPSDLVPRMLIAFLLLFFCHSMIHEILYQRYFWVLLGMLGSDQPATFQSRRRAAVWKSST